MKISKVEGYWLRADGMHSIFVRVFTDQGLYGIGECSPMNCALIKKFIEESLSPLLIGENPLEIDRLWHKMFFSTYKQGVQGLQMEAISGVDIALWDILGKSVNLPIYTLLGGKYRSSLPLYASVGGAADRTVLEHLKAVEVFLDAGFKAVKVRTDYGAARQDRDVEKDYQLVRSLRQQVGDGFQISFDANNGYSVSTAIRQGRRFEDLGLHHFEEPVAPYDYAGIARVADSLDVPVSAGEHEYTRWQFRDLITQANVDIVQPDLVKSGGISESKRIADLASVYNRVLLPHQTQSTIGTMANMHLIAASPWGHHPQEYNAFRPELEQVFNESMGIVNGVLSVPDRLGIGLTINEEALQRFLL